MITPPPNAEPRWTRLLSLLALLPCLMWAGGVVVQHDIWTSDLLHSHLPYKVFLGRALRAGELPLWMPDIFSGLPFLAQIESSALYPPHMVLFALLDPFTALNATLTLDTLLAALGAAALARALGASGIGSALAAVIYAWSGFSISHYRHLNMHAAAALLPWAMLWLERLIAGHRRAGIAVAIVLALQTLAGHPQITFISLLLMGGRAAIALRRPERVRIAWQSALAVALGLGLSAVVLLPTWRFSQSALGTAQPTWEYASLFPYKWRDLWTWVYPPLAGAMETFDYRGGNTIPWGNYSYCGIVALLLAPLGLRRRWFWGAIVLLSVLLVMGPLTPVYRIFWEVLPGMKLFRFPTRFLMTASLGLAVLAAAGLTRVQVRIPTTRGQLVGVAVVLLALLDLTHHHRPRIPVDDVDHWSAPTPLAPFIEPQAARVYTMQEFELWEAAFFASEGFNNGFEIYRRAWSIPMASSVVFSGLRTPSGYARLLHYRTAAFWQGYNGSLLPEAYTTTRPTAESPQIPAAFHAQLCRGAVRYLIADFDIEGLAQLSGAPRLLHEVTDALPRAYVAERWQPVPDMAAAAEWMYRLGLDQPSVPAIESAPTVPADAAAVHTAVPITEHSNHHLSLDVSAAPAGMLVLADSWDDGWSAEVDGEPATLRIANGYQRALHLPADAQLVTMRYWPEGLTAGLLIALLSSLVLLLWGILAPAQPDTP